MTKAQGSLEPALLIDGNLVSAHVREELAKEVAAFTAAGHRRPGLAVVLIGENPASKVYVKNKVLACKKTGIESFQYELPATVTADKVLALINELNERPDVDGILVQLPLPAGLPTEEILDAVSPEKDADGLHPLNMGRLLSGRTGLRPCTPQGIMVLLDHYKVPLAGANAVVIGRSNLVGKPIAIMLQERNCTVTMCHSKTNNLKEICSQADLLVVAAGRQELITADYIKKGATVIDVGIHKVETAPEKSRLCGDVLFDEARATASHITPVPGGVGPMTVAMLLANTVAAYKKSIKSSGG